MRWFRRSLTPTSRWRLLYATDLHGSDRCFRKLLNAAQLYEANIVLIGGDLTGKVLVPLVRQADGWVAAADDTMVHLHTEAEVEGYAQQLADRGAYAFCCDPETLAELERRSEVRDAAFLALMRERLECWIALARERLLPRGIRFLLNCGNDDPLEIDPILRDAEGVEFLEGRAVLLQGHVWVVSVGEANETPWHCPRDVPEAELAQRIEEAVTQVPDDDLPFAVFNLHCPPYQSGIDLAPRLDETFKPVVIGGVVERAPAGSTAVRAAIERYQPQLGLHGHIHESRGTQRLGRTLCLNPGSEYEDGVLRAAVIDFVGDEIKQYLLIGV